MIKILPWPNLTPTNSLVMFINHQHIPINSYSEISEIQDFLKNDLSSESAFSVFKGEIPKNKNPEALIQVIAVKLKVPHYKTKSIWRSFTVGWVWMKIQL